MDRPCFSWFDNTTIFILLVLVVVQRKFGVVQQIFFDKSKKVRKKTQECKNRRFLSF